MSNEKFSKKKKIPASMVAAIATLSFGLGACSAVEDRGLEHQVCEVVQNGTEQDIATANPFIEEKAQQVANELCISSGVYYQLTPEAVSKVTESGLFRKSADLAPVFFPSILEYKDLIEKTAIKNDIPANVLATLASIESAGKQDAESWVGAKGLVQVMPSFHFDKFAPFLPEGASYEDFTNATKGNYSKVSLEEYNSIFNNPEINLDAGAQFLKECIAVSRDANPALNPDSVVIYGIAASCYNGGAGTARGGYDNMPTESKLYVDHVARILLDVEMALRLKELGYKDSEVLGALKSEKMDALAYSYSLQDKSAGYYAFKQNNLIFSTASPDEPDSSRLPAGVWKPIEEYLSGNVEKYTTPMSPGLRIWFASGGRSLFMLSPENRSWRQ